MTPTQKFRLSFIGLALAASLVLLAPTFLKGNLPEWWPTKPMRLGLDLKGGSYVVMEVQLEEAVKSQLNNIGQSVKAELRKKQVSVLRPKVVGDDGIELTLLNDRGFEILTELMATEHKELIKLPEVRDQGQVRVTYKFSPEALTNLKQTAVEQAIETIRNRVDMYGVTEPAIQRSGERQIIVQLPDITDLSTVRESIGKVAKLEFRLVASGNNTSDTKTLQMRNGSTVSVEDEVLMAGDSIEGAIVEIDPQTNGVEVGLKLNSTGARIFDRVTADNTGRQLAIILDNKVQSAPVINERISGGRAQISGAFSSQEANQLAIVLRSGALPAPLKIAEERTVGATLGADSIRSGALAATIATVLVIIFMTIYYRKSGALAVFSVVLNIVFLLATLSLFGATLTLPGIAGLALTVGMAVDANVIIYERIREELRAGTAVRSAIEAGFDRAHWTIVDANISTLLAGLVLYMFGSGPIKGFAVTLSIGVFTTVFAALVISKIGFEVFNMKDRQGKLSI